MTKLPSAYVYGMGENIHESFLHDLDYKNWPVFARDQIAEEVKPDKQVFLFGLKI